MTLKDIWEFLMGQPAPVAAPPQAEEEPACANRYQISMVDGSTVELVSMSDGTINTNGGRLTFLDADKGVELICAPGQWQWVHFKGPAKEEND